MNQQSLHNVTIGASDKASTSVRSGWHFSTFAGSAAQLPPPQAGTPPIAGDILYGADEIALYLFGDPKHRRRVYNLVQGNGLPVFRVGVNICARKSVLLAWIAAQEVLVKSDAT
jgi:hypothetical protein